MAKQPPLTNIKSFFEAKSVAVVGASRHPGKVGHEIISSLLRAEYAGKIFPVNPKAEEIEGVKCYKDLKSIGEAPELVVVVVPAKAVASVVRECGRINARNVVVVTSGFKEIGEEGANLEKELLQAAKESNVRMIGPNCLGLMSPPNKLNASFGGPMPPAGNIGYFSQSGSLLAAIADIARANHIGFSKLVSIGNQADITELDILKTLGQDESTDVIAGYLETIADGDAFVREAERISRNKPILLLKSGETGAGAMAARSHTGRLAGTERAYEVVFERAGIIRCESITAQFDYARALATQPLPEGTGAAIVANAGGPGIMAADATELHGLELAELAQETRDRLAAGLPPAANTHNPIDVLGDALANRFEIALNTALDDANVHMALVLLTPHAMTECSATAEAVVRAHKQHPNKPVFACFIGAERVREAIDILRGANIPCYRSPEFAVSAMKAMASYVHWRNRPKRVVKLFAVNRRKVEKIVKRYTRMGRAEVGEMEAKDILDAYGFVTPRGFVASTAEQAVSFAEQIGYPVVLKIWSPDIVHKTEVGGVRTGLNTAQEVMDAFDLMMYRIPKKRPNATIVGVLVEEMCSSGREVILGMNRDPRFGPLMMFGVGGVMVEVLKDVAFYLAPLTAEEAREMLTSTRAYQMLRGPDGSEDVNIDGIAEGLQRLSQLATEFPQIQEMDINPFVVGPAGTTPIAVDARIVVAENGV